MTKQALLEMAQRDPTTWLGIRITAGLLVLEGWTSSQIAELFGLSRWSVVQWIQRLNKEGVTGLEEKGRDGRPLKLDRRVQNQLEQALMKHPCELGLSYDHWDEITVVEYLEREYGIRLKVHQAQRLLRRMRFSLSEPVSTEATVKRASSTGIALQP